MIIEILKLKKQFSLCRGQGSLCKAVKCEDRPAGLWLQLQTLRRNLSKVQAIYSTFLHCKHQCFRKLCLEFLHPRQGACKYTHRHFYAFGDPWGQLSFLFLWLFSVKWCSQVWLPGHTAQSVYLPFLDCCKQRLMGSNYYCFFYPDRVVRPRSCGQPPQDSWGMFEFKDQNSVSHPGIR